MKRSRERKGEIGFEEKLCNPVFNFSKRKQGLRLKHLSTDLGENESARAVYPFRPSGWFQRGGSKMQQKSSLMPERILDLAPVGMLFKGFPDSESSEI